MLGLPDQVRACLFDLDGVLTRTAKVHASAWKVMFDEFLERRASATGAEFVPFDEQGDYHTYVDGKPRYDGVRSFLAARGITLPDGDPADAPDVETVCGLGNRKNELVVKLIAEGVVERFDDSIDYVRRAREAGLRCAVVSSSKNCQAVLQAARIEDLFEARVDGLVAEQRGLPGKPAPDTFVAGAEALGMGAADSAVFEDAISGVEAGRAGNFAYVIGVDRVGQADALREHGADIVVGDLSELG